MTTLEKILECPTRLSSDLKTSCVGVLVVDAVVSGLGSDGSPGYSAVGMENSKKLSDTRECLM